jgi:hypothetical protein
VSYNLKIYIVCSSETSVNIYKIIRCFNSEDQILQEIRGFPLVFQRVLQRSKNLVLVFRRVWTITERCSKPPSTFHIVSWFLGTFAKLQKRLLASSCLYVCLSVRLSVHMGLGSHWTDFYKILYLRIFRKSVEKIQAQIICDKNNGYVAWRPMYIYVNILLNSF